MERRETQRKAEAREGREQLFDLVFKKERMRRQRINLGRFYKTGRNGE